MAIDNTKLDYSSQWDIDKVIDYKTTSASVGAGASTTVTVNHAYGSPALLRPHVIAQYKPSTQTTWFEAGENLQFSTSQLVSMDVWVTTSTIKFHLVNSHGNPVTVAIRYWVQADGY